MKTNLKSYIFMQNYKLYYKNHSEKLITIFLLINSISFIIKQSIFLF